MSVYICSTVDEDFAAGLYCLCPSSARTEVWSLSSSGIGSEEPGLVFGGH